MWFWSVSWSTNCPVYFSFFLVDQKNFVQSQIFFVHSLEFFVQSFSKNEKLTGQLVGQETDQNHMDVPRWVNFCFADQKKDELTGRSRLTKTTWTPLLS